MEAANEEKKGGDPKPQQMAMPVVFKPSGFVPPAPKAGVSIPKPTHANANVKTFTTSDGKAPWMMSLPGIESEPKPEMPEGQVEGQGGAGGAPIDDGFTPEQKRKM